MVDKSRGQRLHPAFLVFGQNRHGCGAEKLFYNLSRIKARLGLYENKELEPKVVKAIAHELMVDEKDVTEMNRRIGGDSSLNVSVGDDEDGHEKSI